MHHENFTGRDYVSGNVALTGECIKGYHNKGMYYFQKKLKELGIEDELKRQGICEGDYVKMLNWTFEWYQ